MSYPTMDIEIFQSLRFFIVKWDKSTYLPCNIVGGGLSTM
jgi:hypothetical protein